jgi:hypothetical protein
VKETRPNSHTVSLAAWSAARSHRADVPSFELFRASRSRFHSRSCLAESDAFDRLLHSETLTRPLVLFVVSRCSHRAPDAFRRRPFDDPRSEACASCPPARRRAACRPPHPDTREGRGREDRAPRGSGPLDASETGEGRVSRRDPHCAPRRFRSTRRCAPGGCSCVRAADIPVASSAPSLGECAFAIRCESSKAAKTDSAGAS